MNIFVKDMNNVAAVAHKSTYFSHLLPPFITATECQRDVNVR